MNGHYAETLPGGVDAVGIEGRICIRTVAFPAVAHGTLRPHHRSAADDVAVSPNRLLQGKAVKASGHGTGRGAVGVNEQWLCARHSLRRSLRGRCKYEIGVAPCQVIK